MSDTVNEKLQLAHNFILHTNRNVFLTGKAGTGKTTFLQQVKTLSAKRLAVVAPTGVAAINAGGVTIHSLFQLPFGPLVPGATNREARRFTRDKIKLLRTLDLLIIDEISMVRADVLDGIDEVLRRYRNQSQPFGGVQLLLIGDMQQLPPVIRDEEWALLRPHYDTGYFFGSKALQETPYVSIELTHIYRQSDERFIAILNSIREKNITPAQLAELNQRYVPNFEPDEDEGYITLSTHNGAAQQINSQQLLALVTSSHTFNATVEGDFPAHTYPTEAELELKVGAQVMFIKNDISREKLYYNGKIGRITAINDEVIHVKSGGDDLTVGRLEWTNVRYSLDPSTQEIVAEPIGRFVQYPLRLAWAITIHKSQGLTFEKAIIDASAAFAHGQVYVALSRCKTLEGIVLREPIPSHSIKTELTLEEFHEQVQQQTPSEKEFQDAKRTSQEALLRELFSFERAAYTLNKSRQLVSEHAGSFDEGLLPALIQLDGLLREKARSVTHRFLQQLPAYFAAPALPEDNGPLQERVRKGGAYFQALLADELLPQLRQCPAESDNKQVRDAVLEALDETEKEFFTKLQCFGNCLAGFVALTYLQTRNRAELDFMPARRKAEAGRAKETANGHSHGNLYGALIKWRDDLAGEHNVSGHQILPRKVILDLVRARPTTISELQSIKGIGKTKARQLGEPILNIIQSFSTQPAITREDPASAPAKEPKTPSPALSLALFRAGKTIAQIAAERKLAVSTIEGHLAHYVGTGALAIQQLMPPEKIDLIRAYLEENQPDTLSAIKTALGDAVTYTEIRFVYNAIRAELTEQNS